VVLVQCFDKLSVNGLGVRQGPSAHPPPFGLSLSKPGHSARPAFDKLRLNGRLMHG